MAKGCYIAINASCCVVESWGDKLECRGESMGGGVRVAGVGVMVDGRGNMWHLLR